MLRMSEELAGNFLVAMEPVAESIFHRSVILMLEHDSKSGGVGLIVNRATDYPMASLCENLDLVWRGGKGDCVCWGGPVALETGWVLLAGDADENIGAVSLLPGLAWSRSQQALARVSSAPTESSRVYLGYAGWSAGQLEREIEMGAWLVTPADKALVFERDLDCIWARAVRLLGIDPAALISTSGVN